jgi:hypothetical protein
MTRTKMTSAFVLLAAAAFVPSCGKSTTEDASGRKLTLVAPADQNVKQASTEKVAIAIVRRGFDGPVEIDVDDLPSGVSMLGGTHAMIPAGSLTTDLTLLAEPNAKPVRDHKVQVNAKGPDGLKVTEYFRLTVAPIN